MNLNVLPAVNFKAISKTNFINASNPIKFKGLDHDTFEKSPAQRPSVQEQYRILTEIDKMIDKAESEAKELRRAYMLDEYYEKKDEIKLLEKMKKSKMAELNPNIAFLYDDGVSWSERRKILDERDEIVTGTSLNEFDDCCFRNTYYYSPYFIFTKAGGVNFLDTSWDVNKQNYEIMNNENLASYSQICEKYGFTTQELNRYVKEGMFKPIHLVNLETQQKEAVHIIDLSDEESIEALERHRKIHSITLDVPFQNKDYLSAKTLSALGYGTQNEIMKAVQYHKLPGQIITKETQEGEKKVAYVAFKHPKAIGALAYLRNENAMTVNCEQLAKIAKIDITDVEDALLSGEIEYIPYCLFEKEKSNIFFNLKNPKNIKFINKKNFEYEIIQEQLKSKRKEKASLRSKIAWELCPETRSVAKAIVAQHPEYSQIFEKVDAIKDYKERAAKGELEENEVRPFLTKYERIKLKTFYKAMWQQAGTEEYKEAMVKAKTAIIQYETGGIEKVEDNQIKQIITEFYKNA